MGLFDWIRPLYNFASQHGRRANVVNGRAHVELRAMNARQAAEMARHLPESLSLLEGVHWVDVNAAMGRAIVAFDDALCELGYITKVVDRVEAELGLHVLPFSIERPEHPGDVEPLVRCVIELGGDVVGVGLALLGRVVRAPTMPLEIDALAVLSLFDAPRLRRAAEDRLGRQTTSLVLTLSNAVAQGLAQSPLGPVVDIAHHGLVLVERVVRHRTWTEREAELCATPGTAASATDVPARVVDLPAGPIERYADAALLGATGAFALGVVATGSIADATAPLLSGLPKPARLGREAFASYLALALALRGVVPLDRQALRRLDRVDCIVVPLELLVRFDVLPGSFVAVEGCDPALLRRQLATLVDPCRPSAVSCAGAWSVGPLDARAKRDAGTSYPLLALRHGDVVVAVTRARSAVDLDGEALLQAARKAGMRVVVVASDPTRVTGVDVDEVVDDGPGLADEVRRLQREGRVVCVVESADAAALAVADCGIGLVRAADRAPWTADLLCGDRLDDARFIVEACRSARVSSLQSVQLAGIGAGLGLVMSLGGLNRETSGRVATAVNVTSPIAIANGVRLSAALALRPTPARRDTMPWHALDVTVVMERLRTSFDGLAVEEAARRYVGAASPTGMLTRLGGAVMDQLRNPLTPILAVGAGLSAVAGSVLDAALVSSVVVLNAAIGGVQQLRTDQAIETLSADGPTRVRVRREGRDQSVPSDAVVPGDVLVLRAGDAVPADCRIVAQDGLEVDESSLTGESLPVAKTVRASRAADVAERSSMLYDGTSIAAGTAMAVVVAVGEGTETRRAAGAARGRTPAEGVEARLESLTNVMAPTAVISGIAVAAAGLLRGRPGRDVVGAGTSLAVAAVPEGLPLLATAAQLAAARRLSLRGTLVRNPRTIEALGRVDVVCFDKTGTVTEGRLCLHTVRSGGIGAVEEPERRAIVAAALRATPEATQGRALPHPTDQALADAAAASDVTPADGAPSWTRLAELPFEPARAYHATLGRIADTLRMSVKGAPEVVLARCRAWMRGDGSLVPMDAGSQARLAEDASRLAADGLRVLAVAERDVPLDAAFDAETIVDLCFRGFLGFSDPVRATAGGALRGLRAAGVTPMLMTGDHPGTAARIARELEITDRDAVVTGAEVEELDDDALDDAVRATRVFARVTPAHKARLIAALQRAGHTVAMTGDGANDAAAIRMANVGIALGRRGTAAARDAADLVVTDDRIETIVDAVLEGRAMWVSLRDAVAVLVGGNLGELAFSVAIGVLGGEPPLNARQLLVVNLLTDVAPALAIALRPLPHTTAEALLHEGPDASLGAHLTADIAWRATFTAAGAGAAWMATRARGARGEAGTVALTALVATQLGQTLVTGGRSPLVMATGLGSLAALGVIVQTPGVSQLCGCTPLGPVGWTTALAAAGAATAASVALPWMWPETREWIERRARAMSHAWPAAGSQRVSSVVDSTVGAALRRVVGAIDGSDGSNVGEAP